MQYDATVTTGTDPGTTGEVTVMDIDDRHSGRMGMNFPL